MHSHAQGVLNVLFLPPQCPQLFFPSMNHTLHRCHFQTTMTVDMAEVQLLLGRNAVYETVQGPQYIFFLVHGILKTIL